MNLNRKFHQTLISVVFILLLFLNPAQAQMLDSLDRAMIDSALGLLNLKPEELGFDKLWAADDTFRLAVVEKYLNDPYIFPDYVDETQVMVDSFARKPYEMFDFINQQLIVDPEAKLKKAPAATEWAFDPASPFAMWIQAIEQAEPYRKDFYADLDSAELQDLILAAPGLWSEEENDSLRNLIKGSWFREFDVEYDTSAEVGTDRILDIIKKLDMESLIHAGMIAVPAAQMTARGFASEGFTGEPYDKKVEGVVGEVLYYLESEKWGRMIVGGEGDNIYYGDFTVILDPGGADVYRGRCAGSIGEISYPYSLVVDLEGNDLFDSDKKDVAHGAGFLGVGVLIDRGGDDSYRSGGYAQGAGMFGIGVLADHQGADDRKGSYFLQGAGHCGIGCLIDDGDETSDDRYSSACWSQGFAGTYGYGLFFDDGGDDIYRAGGTYFHAPLLPHDYRSFSAGFGMGWRPRAGGGIGVMYDKGDGNDFYDQEVMSIGSSYWYSIGICIDGGGNDNYALAHYGMGVGIHLSLGAFYETGGDDQYHSRHGVVGGTPHDFSVGIMVDGGGDDYYIVGDGWGGSLTNSYGLFIDRIGNDTYATRGGGHSFGSARWARGFAGTAIFLDLEGNDVYTADEAARDSSIWIQTGWGIGMDLPRNVETEKEEKFDEVEPTAEDSAKSIEELYRLASQWEVGSARESVARSRKALLAKGPAVVEFIVYGPDRMLPEDISNLKQFIVKLRNEEHPVSEYFYPRISGSTKNLIEEWEDYSAKDDSTGKALKDSVAKALTADLNKILRSEDFYTKSRFKNIDVDERAMRKIERDPSGDDLFRANWHLLEQAYPKEIVFRGSRLYTRSSLENRLLDQIVKETPDTAGAMLMDVLPKAAEDEDPRYVANVIGLLNTLKWEPAVDPLLEMLDDKDQKRVWNTIISALGGIGDKKATPEIVEFLDSEDEKTRIIAIGALGSLEDATAIEPIVDKLNDPMFTVRSRALMVIAGFKADALPSVLSYLEDAGSEHPENALYAVGRIARDLKEDEPESKRVKFKAVQILEDFLSHENPFLRSEAVVGLYRIGGEETKRFIERRMEHEYNPVVIAAFERMKREAEN